MMAVDLSIPAYLGGYRMDADALRIELMRVRDQILAAALTEEERRGITHACHERQRWTLDQINDALISRVQEVLPVRLDWRTDGWSVQELLQEFDRLRSEMEREFGVVR